MHRTNCLSQPENKPRGRPPGARNKVYDASPHFKMKILHEVANLAEHHDLTPNQVYEEAARAIFIRLKGPAELNTKLGAANVKRFKIFLQREQESYDNTWFHYLNQLLRNYQEYCSDWDDYDPETERFPGRPPSFEAWSEAEWVTLDHEFPPLPQGVTRAVAEQNPLFRFKLRLRATRRRRKLNVPIHN